MSTRIFKSAIFLESVHKYRTHKGQGPLVRAVELVLGRAPPDGKTARVMVEVDEENYQLVMKAMANGAGKHCTLVVYAGEVPDDGLG